MKQRMVRTVEVGHDVSGIVPGRDCPPTEQTVLILEVRRETCLRDPLGQVFVAVLDGERVSGFSTRVRCKYIRCRLEEEERGHLAMSTDVFASFTGVVSGHGTWVNVRVRVRGARVRFRVRFGVTVRVRVKVGVRVRIKVLGSG
jgi:hypothetical protein